MLTRRPVRRRAGRTLLTVVALYGVTMIVFGLSETMWLSLLALAAGGAVDMVSVVLRQTILPLVTPDELRGRVNAVEMVFISASNELGAFESGVAAALIGAVPAVVIGGVLTIGVALTWTRMFPALATSTGSTSSGRSRRLRSVQRRAPASSAPRSRPRIEASSSSTGWSAGSGCAARPSACATCTRQPGLALA